MGRNEGDENLKSLGDILGDIIGRVISVCISNNVPADLYPSIHVLAPLEINYVNSCGWRDRIEDGKQPLSGLPWPGCGNTGLG